MKNIKYKIRYFFEGVQNIIKWIPIIYHDKDWDHTFIYKILQFKLTQQSKYIGGHNRHMSAIRDSNRMDLIAKLLELNSNEFYDTEYMDYHESEMVWSEVEGKPNLLELDILEFSNNFDEYFKKYPNMYRRVLKMDEPIFKLDYTKKTIAMNIAYYNQRRCHKLIFKLLERNIEKFWD
jgi:hypothetical protein